MKSKAIVVRRISEFNALCHQFYAITQVLDHKEYSRLENSIGTNLEKEKKGKEDSTNVQTKFLIATSHPTGLPPQVRIPWAMLFWAMHHQ